MVYVYNKNPDGTIGSKYKNVNWQNQDSNINYICEPSSSVPYAYAVFTEGAVDKLVGWGSNGVMYLWDIVDGNISNRRTYSAPFNMQAYSRGGWDGGNYVYFCSRSNSILYRWDINNKSSQPIALVTLASYTSYVSSSFTGSGLYVDAYANEVYASTGANQQRDFYLVGI